MGLLFVTRIGVGVVLAFLLGSGPASAAAPVAQVAATCGDYSNQAQAQRGADTRDADRDGIYCESLPCPCLKPGRDGSNVPRPDRSRPEVSCVRPRRVISISFSGTKYPNIRRHFLDAVERGWPRILVLNRVGADARRDRLLRDYSTRDGYDREEYPPAIGRGRGAGLTKGSDPRGWRASVRYVRSSENRSHGATMGIKTRRYCNGTRFRYVFY